MSYMKRLMDEHGICEAYIESRETSLNTAKDKIQELADALGRALDYIEAEASINAEKAAEIWLTGTAALTKAEEFIGKEKGDSEILQLRISLVSNGYGYSV